MTDINITGTKLQERFITEQEYIQKSVNFLDSKTKFFNSEVRRIIATLVRYKLMASGDLVNIPSKNNVDIYENAQDFLDFIGLFAEKITSFLQESKVQFEEIVKNTKPVADHEHEAWSNYVGNAINALEFDTSNQNIQVVSADLKSLIPVLFSEFGIDIPENSLKSNQDVVEYITKRAISFILRKRIRDLTYVVNKIEEIKISARMSTTEAEISILRQSFIVLMTIFDATIFDIVKIGLKHNFFKLIGLLSRQDKISLESLGKYNSYQEFRDQLIDEQLRNKYIKDLLLFLEKQGVQCVEPDSGYNFAQLIEMINRRNIHVHNRGQVDERYLERDHKGTPKFNTYNLSLGAIAQINTEYWNTANILCSYCISSAAQWADSQSIT